MLFNLLKTTTQLAIKSCLNNLTSTACKQFSSLSISSTLKKLPYSNTNNGLFRSSLLKQIEQSNTQAIQVRNNWGYKGRMMLKDIKRRELLRKYAPLRIRLQAMRANTILPKAFKKSVEEQLQKLTRHSTLMFVTNRCQFTSKAGGCLNRWRLSRHIWRDQADYNQMSGVTRAVWGVPTRNSVHFTFKKARKSWFNYDGYRDISFIDRNGQTQKYRFKLN